MKFSGIRRLLRKTLPVLAAALATITPFTPPMAADFYFPGSSFGKLLLTPDQSVGGNAALLAAQDGAAFEPISEFNLDDRYRQFSAPIARLDMLVQDSNGDKLTSVCTANLIAPDVLLTNYHCIPGKNFRQTVLRSVAVFDYLREDQEEAPTYEVDITPLAADYDLDFALLRVYGEPGNKFGYFRLQAQAAKPNQSLFIIHHPAGMPKRLTRFRCKAYAPKPYAAIFFRHRCDTMGGSSGSLIFNLDFQVVALHNQGGLNKDSSTSFNRGISIYALMKNPEFAAYFAPPPAPTTDALPPPADLLTLNAQNNPKPEEPVLSKVKLTPMAVLLADQARKSAPAPKEPVEAPFKGFSIYNRSNDSAPEIAHKPSPVTAKAVCDRVLYGRICASSMLEAKGNGKYSYRMANLALDDGLAWVENKRGYGIGEWLVFEFNREKSVSEIVFRNGYSRTQNTYSSNSRVAEVTVETSGGNSYRVKMSDSSGLQSFKLAKPEKVKWIRLFLDSVFKGDKHADTALSYIGFR